MKTVTSFNASCLSDALRSCRLISFRITRESSSFFLYRMAVPYAPVKMVQYAQRHGTQVSNLKLNILLSILPSQIKIYFSLTVKFPPIFYFISVSVYKDSIITLYFRSWIKKLPFPTVLIFSNPARLCWFWSSEILQLFHLEVQLSHRTVDTRKPRMNQKKFTLEINSVINTLSFTSYKIKNDHFKKSFRSLGIQRK